MSSVWVCLGLWKKWMSTIAHAKFQFARGRGITLEHVSRLNRCDFLLHTVLFMQIDNKIESFMIYYQFSPFYFWLINYDLKVNGCRLAWPDLQWTMSRKSSWNSYVSRHRRQYANASYVWVTKAFRYMYEARRQMSALNYYFIIRQGNERSVIIHSLQFVICKPPLCVWIRCDFVQLILAVLLYVIISEGNPRFNPLCSPSSISWLLS